MKGVQGSLQPVSTSWPPEGRARTQAGPRPEGGQRRANQKHVKDTGLRQRDLMPSLQQQKEDGEITSYFPCFPNVLQGGYSFILLSLESYFLLSLLQTPCLSMRIQAPLGIREGPRGPLCQKAIWMVDPRAAGSTRKHLGR